MHVPSCKHFRGANILYTLRLQDDENILALVSSHHNHPRFKPENLKKNVSLLDPLISIARELGCQPAQIALAWLLSQGDDIVPIPGTKRVQYLEENIAALNIHLNPEQIERLNETFKPGVAAGDRYPAGQLKILGR